MMTTDANVTTSSRRSILTAACATLFGAAAAAPSALARSIEPADARLIGLCAEFTALEQRYQGLFREDEALAEEGPRIEAQDRISRQKEGLADLIEATPAASFAGIRAKAFAAHICIQSDPASLSEAPVALILDSVLRDLTGDMLF